MAFGTKRDKIRPPKGRKSPLSAVQQESGVAGKQRKHRPVDDFGLFLKMQSHLTGLVRVVCLQGDLRSSFSFSERPKVIFTRPSGWVIVETDTFTP